MSSERDFKEIFNDHRKEQLNKIIEELMAVPYICRMITNGEYDKVREYIETHIDEELSEREPNMVTFKDGTVMDLRKLIMMAFVDAKLDQHKQHRNDAYMVLKAIAIGGGILIGMGVLLIRMFG